MNDRAVLRTAARLAMRVVGAAHRPAGGRPSVGGVVRCRSEWRRRWEVPGVGRRVGAAHARS